ncbi:MAG: hypothetical protein IKM29_03130 [Clostridia bacterium]|nr:hypothetical protein [Clostridia bacterium]
MFCGKCGNDAGGAAFCPVCGVAMNGEIVSRQQYVDTVDIAHQRGLEEMTRIYNYFIEKRALYDDHDTTYMKVEKLKSRLFFGWIILAVIGLMIAVIAKSVFFYIISPGFIALYVLFKMKNKKKRVAEELKLSKLEDEIYKHYTDYEKTYGYVCPVGFKYTRPDVMEALKMIVLDGRADLPKEAIGVYKDDLAREEYKKLQEEANNLQREANDIAKKTQKDVKKAKRYAAASFWLK